MKGIWEEYSKQKEQLKPSSQMGLVCSGTGKRPVGLEQSEPFMFFV